MHLIYDIGGTNVRAGAYDPARKELCGRSIVPTPANGLEFSRAMLEAGNEALGDCPPTAIVIGFPGPIGSGGRPLASPTIKCAVDIDECLLALSSRWRDVPVKLLNDVTMAGYYFCSLGATDFAAINVGSGIGIKVFLGGQPVVGPNGLGGEIGHLVVDRSSDAMLCDCGGKGHLGMIASGRGFLALARRRAISDPAAFQRSSVSRHCSDAQCITNGILVDAFHANDMWCRSIVKEATQYLGLGLAAVHLIVGLERFYIVGGFASALGLHYRTLLVDAAQSSTWDMGQDWNEMIALEQQDDIALLGGGYFMSQENKR